MQDIRAFNNEISSQLASGGFRGEIEAYHVYGFNTTDRGGIPADFLRKRRCVLYHRISGAVNYRNTVANEVPKLIECYGLSTSGRINACFILDEDQNNIQSAQCNRFKKEISLHVRNYRQELEAAVQQKLEQQYEKDLRQAHPDWAESQLADRVDDLVDETLTQMNDRDGAWTVPALVRRVVCVTATCQARLITSGTPVRITTVGMPPDYFGFDEQLPDERAIELVSVEPGHSIRFPGYALTHPLNAYPYVAQLIKRDMAKPGFQHTICYVQAPNNQQMEEMANELLWRACPDNQVVLACLCYASSREHVFGAVIMGNNDPRTRAIMALMADADAELHTVKTTADKQAHASVGSQSSNGKRILHRGGQLKLYGKLDTHHPDRLPMVYLPRTASYRIRVQLDLIAKACELAGQDPGDIKLITLGSHLLKEGITVKTSAHQYPASSMILAGASLANGNIDHIRLMQVAGRLCGRRGPSAGNVRPRLYALPGILDELKAALILHQQMMDHVNAHCQLAPLASLQSMQPDVPFHHPVAPRRIVSSTLHASFYAGKTEELLDPLWDDMLVACAQHYPGEDCTPRKDICHWRRGVAPQLPPEDARPADLYERTVLYEVLFMLETANPVQDVVCRFLRLALLLTRSGRVPLSGLPVQAASQTAQGLVSCWTDLCALIGMGPIQFEEQVLQRARWQSFAYMQPNAEHAGYYCLAPEFQRYWPLERDPGPVQFSPDVCICTCQQPSAGLRLLICSLCQLLYHYNCMAIVHNCPDGHCTNCCACLPQQQQQEVLVAMEDIQENVDQAAVTPVPQRCPRLRTRSADDENANADDPDSPVAKRSRYT